MAGTSPRSHRRSVALAVGVSVVVVLLIGAMVALWAAGPDGSGTSARDVDAEIDTPVSAENVVPTVGEVADCPASWTEPGRTCRWYSSAPSAPGPAVILLHGYTSTPGEILAEGRWPATADEHGLTVVAPGGISQSWNGGTCCAEARRQGVDDAAYLSDLIDSVAALPEVDPAQVYAVGFSNGGLMVYKLLCEAGDKLAGAASVAGTDVAGCPASEPVPVLHLHGTSDEVVPYRGGVSLQSVLLGVQFPPVAATFKKMVVEQNCDTVAATSEEPNWVVTRYENCDDDTALELRTVEGATHRYNLVPDVDTTETILDYFGLT